jgi:hypothetical protein
MTEVKQLDATYSFRFRDDREAEKVLALMRNVSTQHIRKSTKDATFKNTFISVLNVANVLHVKFMSNLMNSKNNLRTN